MMTPKELELERQVGTTYHTTGSVAPLMPTTAHPLAREHWSGPTSTPDIMHVIEGVELSGKTNVDDETYRAHIRSAIRRHHPQLRVQGLQTDRICLVGGGPSLNDTLPELLELLRAGAKLATVNGAYHWALDHNLEPKVQIVLDARPSNARFVDPPLPRCHYLVASVCHPDVWDRVEGRDRTWIYHPVTKDDEAAKILNDYYGEKNWYSVLGGTTVTTRALFALRMFGYLRYNLFGTDLAWGKNGQHHAYPQPENESDQRYKVTVSPTGHPEMTRDFECAGWHIKALEDFLQIVRVNGDQFLINVHGDGLLAHVMNVNAELADLDIKAIGGSNAVP